MPVCPAALQISRIKEQQNNNKNVAFLRRKILYINQIFKNIFIKSMKIHLKIDFTVNLQLEDSDPK